MNNEKSIYACYEEIKRREIRELEKAVRNAGGKVSFDEDDAPIVMCNFDGFIPHPADVRVTRVELCDEEDEDVLHIFGQEKGTSACAIWFDNEMEIQISEIAYGNIDFIVSAISNTPQKINDVTNRLCETVSELSHLLYDKLYDKYEDSFATDREIIRLSILFEERFGSYDDFLEEIDKFVDEYLKNLEKD